MTVKIEISENTNYLIYLKKNIKIIYTRKPQRSSFFSKIMSLLDH